MKVFQGCLSSAAPAPLPLYHHPLSGDRRITAPHLQKLILFLFLYQMFDKNRILQYRICALVIHAVPSWNTGEGKPYVSVSASPLSLASVAAFTTTIYSVTAQRQAWPHIYCELRPACWIRLAVAAPVGKERRAVCLLQLQLNLWVFCSSDSGSIQSSQLVSCPTSCEKEDSAEEEEKGRVRKRHTFYVSTDNGGCQSASKQSLQSAQLVSASHLPD